VALGDGKGVASGRITVSWRPESPLTIDARLSELGVSLTRAATGADGRVTPQRIWMRNAGPIRVVMADEQIVLDETRLVTDGGDFKLRGELRGDQLTAALTGHLDLDLLQPFLRGHVERLSGDLALELTVGGTTALPRLEGTIAVSAPIVVRPIGVDADLSIPSGFIRLEPNALRVTDFVLSLDGATMKLGGEARLDAQLRPVALDLDARGEVSARLLETLAPTAISEASGRARVQARVRGNLEAPDLSGRIDVGSVELRLRNLGRQVSLEGGSVELTSREILVRDVRARIDDQGLLRLGAGRPGRIEIKQVAPVFQLGSVELPLRGERLGYREPRSVEVDDLGFTLELFGDVEEGLQLAGEVRVASGRYVRDFTVRELVISPSVNESDARPFHDGQPLLANLGLDLRVRTIGDSFLIQNNLAPEIRVILDLSVSGTLADPRIAGAVRPTDGRFHIIGLRGDFDLLPNVNHITFVETKSLERGETPELNLEAENEFTDALGNEYRVRMRINGPVGRAAIDLSAEEQNGGRRLNRNQTLVLLVSGRTSDEVARLGTRNPTFESNVRSGTDMVGQLTRDTVANLVEPYIDDTLQMLTGRWLKLSARTSRELEFEATYLRGWAQNRRQYRLQLGGWLYDYFTARVFWEQLSLTPQQGLNEELSSTNLELTYQYPLRFFRF
jgi:hypothetical protein